MSTNECWATNAGGEWLWNDGGCILINEQLSIISEGPSARADVFLPKRTTPVKFTFWVRASIRRKIVIKLLKLESLLRPKRLVNEIQTNTIKEKIILYLKKEVYTELRQIESKVRSPLLTKSLIKAYGRLAQ